MVREKKLLSLIEAVRRCTYHPARTIGIKDRGRICKGAKADLFVFNPDTIKDNADFPGIGNPDLPPDGIEFVFVNGECAIKNGKRVESCNAGKILRFN
jgi:N-acyl-D-amino-acid deacylase